MKNYHTLLKKVFDTGEVRNDRTGTGTLSVFGESLRFDLADGFPLLTTKKVSFKNVIAELCMFINAESNISYLHKYDCHIWDEWADESGNLGRIYGVQWRDWTGVERAESDYIFELDQLKKVVESLKSDPHGRRHLVTAWNPAEFDHMALPPCHYSFQFYVSTKQLTPKLSCLVNMRSADIFLGVPYNIGSYAALTHLIARILNYDVGELIMNFGDLHLYMNHVPQTLELLRRDPEKYSLPQIEIEPPYTIEMSKVHPEQFRIVNYQSYPAIKAPISV